MKSKTKKCFTEGCNNYADRGNYCHACWSKKYRAKHPLKYLFDNLKNNAKRRGKDFTLTLDEFKDFAIKSGYSELHGREADCLSVDRKNPLLGYSKDNIRVITVSDNVKLERGSLVIDDPDFQQTDYVPF